MNNITMTLQVDHLIMEALRDKNCKICNITGQYKDPNDIFMHNKKEFIKLIYKAINDS